MAAHQSLFITLEGGEGSGKSSIMDRLSQDLEADGYAVVKTREPGGSNLGEQIREWLLHKKANVAVSNRAELLLFLAARAQHIDELIEPALKEGKVVICDRFNESSIAYQGAARGLGMDYVQKQCLLACHGVTPDLTFFYDVDPVIGLERTRKTVKASAEEGQVDRIESETLAFHENVRLAMQELASQNIGRIHTIDAAQPLDTAYAQTLAIVRERLKKE